PAKFAGGYRLCAAKYGIGLAVCERGTRFLSLRFWAVLSDAVYECVDSCAVGGGLCVWAGALDGESERQPTDVDTGAGAGIVAGSGSSRAISAGIDRVDCRVGGEDSTEKKVQLTRRLSQALPFQ